MPEVLTQLKTCFYRALDLRLPLMGWLTSNGLRLAIRGLVFALVNGDDEHHNLLINDLIDQSVTRAA